MPNRMLLEQQSASGVQFGSPIFLTDLNRACQTAAVALHGTSELAGMEQVAAGIQVGTCINRWYDKSLQIIVCQNGAAGASVLCSKLTYMHARTHTKTSTHA